METRKPVTTSKLRLMKQKGTPIAMVTAYDYPSAKFAEEAGADMILVGDSLGNVVLGYDTTIPVTLDDMIYHTRAVARGAKAAFIVTDLPFMTYHGSIDASLANVARVMQEGGCKAVKVEGGAEIAPTVKAIVDAGVPVLGHLGFTPQSIHQIGGYKVQGKNVSQAEKLIEDAKALEQAGAFAVVLEMVTEPLAERVTKELSIPTIGIGAGRGCDGQVLVFHDILQYSSPYHPKTFVKTYANIGETVRNALSEYVSEVKSRAFPDETHVFKGEQDVIQFLYGDK